MSQSYTALVEPSTTEDVECRYRQVISQLPVAIYLCDKRGFITEFNQAAAELWGREPECGTDLFSGALKMFSPGGATLPIEQSPIAISLREGQAPPDTEIIIERPDGSRKRVLSHPRLLLDSSGGVCGALDMLEDVTLCRENEEKTAHLAAIVKSSDDAIISKTLDGIITSWNDAAQRIFGYTPEEIIGQPVLRLIPEYLQHEEPVILDKLRRGERVDHFQTRRITKDRRILDISLTISPVKDSKGHIIGVSKIVRDITEQKRTEKLARENEERFRMAVSAIKIGTWEWSPATGIVKWSENCRDIYQVPAELEPDFELLTRLTYPEDAPIALGAIENVMDPRSGGTYDLEFRIVRYVDKSVRWVRSQGKMFFSSTNAPERFIGTILDITDEISAKSALEQTIAERTRDLKNANQKLAASNSDLEQFAFVASHDLQEPLRKIQAFGDMLKGRINNENHADDIDLINRMQSASSRMKTLIDNLLSFSRVSFKECEHKLVDLGMLLEDVLTDLETSIKEKNASIQVGQLFPICGEPMHLRQLFQNLIGNALKFSRRDLPPAIDISSHIVLGRKSGMDIPENVAMKTFQMIEVKDNGIGFEPEYSRKIFQLFQRLHGKTDYPGSGMGLSIVQKIVSNHNGFINALSSPGQGANFRILLPFSPETPVHRRSLKFAGMTEDTQLTGDEEWDDELDTGELEPAGGPAERVRIIIDKRQDPLRIDKFLMNRLEGATRNKIQQALEDGHILVNGVAVKANYKIRPGDEIVVFETRSAEFTEIIPEELPLDIVYEDDTLMIINKKAGMVVHPGCGNYSGTLVNGLSWYLQQQNGNESELPRVGLVHRIDKDTTGLVVIAKTEAAMAQLAAQFKKHTVHRRYVALVWGDLEQDHGTIVAHVGRHERFRKKFAAYPEGEHGKEAITHYKVLERFGYVTLVELQLETGRTHQIRVHLQSIGHPLFGDATYGGDRIVKGTIFSKYKQFVENTMALIPRQALHARELGFIHPATGEKMFFTSDLPGDMSASIERWRRYTAGAQNHND